MYYVFRQQQKTILQREAAATRKRTNKRKSDDEQKKRDAENVAQKLNEYTTNNASSRYSNLNISNGSVDTKCVNNPEIESKPTVPQLDMKSIQAIIKATIGGTKKEKIKECYPR